MVPSNDTPISRRVALRPGETRTVSFPLAASSLAYWDADADRWVVEDGTVELQAGASSADVRARRALRVTGGARVTKDR